MTVLIITYSWLATLFSAISIGGHFVNAEGEGIPFLLVEIEGPTYKVSCPTDFDGYTDIYVQEAKIGHTCYLTFSADGYITQQDTIVIKEDHFKKYMMKRVGE